MSLTIRIIGLIASLCALLFTFQNCSPVHFSDVKGEAMLASLSASDITINNNDVYTNNDSVLVQLNVDNPYEMYVTNNADCSTGGEWKPFSKEIPWTLGQKNANSTVYAKFRSEYQVETPCINDSIIHDDIPPVLTLKQKVASVTNAASTAISFAVTEDGSGLDKIICPTDITGCSTDLSLSNTQEGMKVINLYATDKAGNKSLPLQVSWLYDKTGPVISFTSTPANKTNLLASNFKIQAIDNYTSADKITFQYSLDGGAPVASTSAIVFNVTAGSHKITVTGYDEAQNASNIITYSWMVGTTVPNVKFTQTPKPYDNQMGQFAFTGTDQFGDPLVKYECSLNGSAYATCTSPYALANLPQGANSFKIRGTDNLGLVSGDLEYKWVYDTVAPVLSFILNPSPFSKNVNEVSKVSVVEIGGLKYIEFFLDGVSLGQSLLDTAALNNLKEGQHTVKAIAQDMADNNSTPIEYSFYSDFTAPIVDPILVSTPTSNPNISVPVAASDNNTSPLNTLKFFYLPDDQLVYTPFSSPLMLTGLTNGLHHFKVYAVDQAGNTSLPVVSNDFMVDLTPPVVTFVKQPNDKISSPSNAVVNFAVTDSGSGVNTYTCSYTLNGAAVTYATSACMQGTDLQFSISQPGTYVFTVSAVDKVGLSSSKSITFTAANSYVTKTANFSISSTTNKKVDVLLVIDNSGSMAEEQSKLASAFSNFINNLNGLDWRIAITTTDVTNGNGGKIRQFGDNGPYFISSSTTNAMSLLQTYIVTGTDGDGSERGLTAIQNFIDRVQSASETTTTKVNGKNVTSTTVTNPNEKAFYRTDAVFSTVVVSDSDEAAYDTKYKTAEAFLYGTTTGTVGLLSKINNKAYIHHSSVALPNDADCKATSEEYGVTYYNTSLLTGGTNASICSTDYGSQLKNFATTIVTKISQQTLDCSPVDANKDGVADVAITYTLNGSSTVYTVPSTQYTVTNNILSFTTLPDVAGAYTITYTCLAQ